MSSCFPSLVPCLKFTLRNNAANAGYRRQPLLKDSDMESENLSWLIRLSVSDGQKTGISKNVSFIDI